MKTEITLCDVCNRIVANYKCSICGKDLCSSCEEMLNMMLSYKDSRTDRVYINMKDIYTCKGCKKIFVDLIPSIKSEQIFDKPVNDILEDVKKRAVLESLKDKTKK